MRHGPPTRAARESGCRADRSVPHALLADAHAILGDLLAGSSGWIDWNVLLDASGGPNHLGNTCDAPIIASPELDRVHFHPQYYALGHFSKFMPRGSRRIGIERYAPASGDTPLGQTDGDAAQADGVYNFSSEVAYGRCPSTGPPRAAAVKRQDGTLAVVVLNCASEAATVRIEIEQGGASTQHTLPAHAIHTYVLRGEGR